MKIVYNSRRRYKGFSWVWGFVLIGLTSTIMAAISQPEEKKYRIDVTLNEANALLYCLDKSTAEHTTVAALSKLIADQINAQIKIDDSLSRKKLNEKPKQDSSSKKQ